MTVQELQEKMAQIDMGKYYLMLQPHIRHTVNISLQPIDEDEFKIGGFGHGYKYKQLPPRHIGRTILVRNTALVQNRCNKCRRTYNYE
jgi:hypothetical protein